MDQPGIRRATSPQCVAPADGANLSGVSAPKSRPRAGAKKRVCSPHGMNRQTTARIAGLQASVIRRAGSACDGRARRTSKVTTKLREVLALHRQPQVTVTSGHVTVTPAEKRKIPWQAGMWKGISGIRSYVGTKRGNRAPGGRCPRENAGTGEKHPWQPRMSKGMNSLPGYVAVGGRDNRD